MSKTRNLSDLLDANGDVKSTALDNAPSPTLTGIDDNATSTAVTILSSGFVGVGQTNPTTNFHVGDDSAGNENTSIRIEGGSTSGYSQVHFADSGDVNVGRVQYTHSSNTMALYTNDTEAMRIDSSGNVLVGTTTLFPTGGNNVEGITFQSSYESHFSRSGGPAIQVNRKTNDGDLVGFKKDGTTVGSIGSATGGTIFIDGGSTYGGLQFGGNGSTEGRIVPRQNGVLADNKTDLGTNTYRFKDAYLSGNIYLGGTGSANALDDYEEGTFTPLVEGTTTSGSATYTTRVAKYTKVGNIVHFSIFIRWQSGTGSGNLIITGLPFTSVGSSYHSAVTIGWMNIFDYTNGKIPRAYIGASASRVTFEESTDNGTSTTIAYDSQAGLILSGSYETT